MRFAKLFVCAAASFGGALLLAGQPAEADVVYVTSTSTGNVSRYDTVTKAPLGSVSGGPASPRGITVGPDGFLYVASDFTNTVRRVNPAGGSADFATGLSFPQSTVFGPDGNLYVTNYVQGTNTGQVVRFNGTTGASLGVFATAPFFFNDLRFGPDGNLYVARDDFNTNVHDVVRFDGTSGASLGTFASGGSLQNAAGLAFGPTGDLFVADGNGNKVNRYDGATGAFTSTFIAPGTGGVNGPIDLEFNADGLLYLTSFQGQQVLRYNATSGAFVDVLATGPGQLFGLAFVPVPEPGSVAAVMGAGAMLLVRRRRVRPA